MSETRRGPPRPTPRSRLTATEWVALIVSVLWLAGTAFFFLAVPGGIQPMARPVFLMTLLAVFMPVALVWVAAAVARSARVMREESARLQIAVDGLRRAYAREAKREDRDEAHARRIAQMIDRAEGAVAGIGTAAPASALPAPAPVFESQRTLALGTDEAPAALSKADVIRALDFPQDESDAEGFDALRRALEDPLLRRLVQASQDVLTALSEDGIYVDDLSPRATLPIEWRAFAGGTRGKQVERLGVIRDRSSLALVRGRMQADPSFREAVLRFIRQFDAALARFEHGASDEDLMALAQTRTARAFMLTGRPAGLFD